MVHPRMNRISSWVCTVFVLGLGACGSGPDSTTVVPDAGAWAAVDSLDTDAFREAWGRASRVDHERTVRIEVIDASGVAGAYREITVRFTAEDSVSVTVRTDSSGAVGLLENTLEDASGVPAPIDPVSYVLPDDASFLRARNHEKYAVRVTVDSTVSGEHVRRIEVEALPGSGDGEVVRRVRYETRGDDGRLTAVDLEREDNALLFTDRSRVSASTRLDVEGGLVPARAVYETWIRPRFGSEQRFRITTTWSYPSR